MKILILGGAGMLGQKLAALLCRKGVETGNIEELILFDRVVPNLPAGFGSDGPGFKISPSVGDLTSPPVIRKLIDARPDLIFHLASVVSGEAETDFEKGWDTNLHATLVLLENIRRAHERHRTDPNGGGSGGDSGGVYRPKLIFASSIAVFGGAFPDKIGDDFHVAPQTSYGAQKASIEMLVADYSRKGYIDGLSLRVPTVCVRPGKANLAASSFFSGIIREPLNGMEAVLPVDDSVRHWHAPPRTVAGFFIRAAGLDGKGLELSEFGPVRSLNMPGLSCTVAEQIEALRDIAGQEAVNLIKPRKDEAVCKIVAGWPRDFEPARALGLGFAAESDFREIIRIYIDEDLNRS